MNIYIWEVLKQQQYAPSKMILKEKLFSLVRLNEQMWLVWCVLTKCSKDVGLKRLKSHCSSNSHLLRPTTPDFTGFIQDMKAAYESARDVGNFRATDKMQDFTFNQLCYKKCFSKNRHEIQRCPKHSKGGGFTVWWTQIDKIGGSDLRKTTVFYWIEWKKCVHTHSCIRPSIHMKIKVWCKV